MNLVETHTRKRLLCASAHKQRNIVYAYINGVEFSPDSLQSAQFIAVELFLESAHLPASLQSATDMGAFAHVTTAVLGC